MRSNRLISPSKPLDSNMTFTNLYPIGGLERLTRLTVRLAYSWELACCAARHSIGCPGLLEPPSASSFATAPFQELWCALLDIAKRSGSRESPLDISDTMPR
jgi:hypothetical protein